MSAPNTNLEKQKDNHKGPLSGMRLVVIFAVVLLMALIGWQFAGNAGETPDALEAVEGAAEAVTE